MTGNKMKIKRESLLDQLRCAECEVLQTVVKELTKVCQEALEAISSLDESALGWGKSGNLRRWSLRDELSNNLREAIAGVEEKEV